MTKEQIKKTTEETKPYIDYLIDRLVSRKFIAACTATWLVWYDKISGTEWAIFMSLYISTLIYQKYLGYLEKTVEQRGRGFGFFRRGGGRVNDKPIDAPIIPETD